MTCPVWRTCSVLSGVCAITKLLENLVYNRDGEVWSCCFSRVFPFADPQSVGGRSVPQALKDANPVPIPRNGDLPFCDNWRGIALLDVAGKVVSRLVQDRLQQIAEQDLPDSLCGFRRGRSCTNQIFRSQRSYTNTARLVSYFSLTFARRMIWSLERLCGEACNVLVYHPNWWKLWLIPHRHNGWGSF